MMTCERFLNGHGPRVARELLATIPPDTEIDYYGVGGAVSALEAKVATLLDKPAALFLPSGTMAQQIVLRVHGERRGAKSVAFHPPATSIPTRSGDISSSTTSLPYRSVLATCH